MRRSLLVLIISGISTGAVASGYAIWSYVSADRPETAAATAVTPDKPASAGQSTVAALTPPPNATPPGISALLAIEVARLEAGGPSVLAGRSPPKHKVTILANGRAIASVTATDEGQWAAVVPDGIAAGPLELSIVSQPKEGGTPVRGAARQLVVPSGPALASAAAAPTRAQTKTASAHNRAPAPVASPPPIERPNVEIKRSATAPAQARPAEGEDAASKRALAEFEALVERTRKEMATDKTPRPAPAAGSGGVAAPAPSAVASAGTVPPSSAAAAPAVTVRAVESFAAPSLPAKSETKLAAAMPPVVPPSVPAATTPVAPTPAAVQAPIPVPITFATNRAVLTPNGERAASLLAEYLRLKRPAGITLSGHADARGPDGYNMRLSLKRLESIERYLRAAGYSGELSLLPRGKRDPYQGIDRRRLPLREIHQADRRVELRLTP